MIDTFTAIDFETAQGYRWSICQVGLVQVKKGRIVHEVSRLIRPPDNYFWTNLTSIHGICAKDTCNAPSFTEYWPELEPLIQGQLLVAHNAAFDISCLRQTLDYYSLPHPQFDHACTYQLYRMGLAKCCEKYNIHLDHHDALSDARACAELFLRREDISNTKSPNLYNI